MNITDTGTPNVPKLRFPEYRGAWSCRPVSELMEKLSNPVDVYPDELYQQIGVRSHGKGIFHKEAVTGISLGAKRVFWVKPDCFVVNIIFAWEQAVARTSATESGMIASHRFPMYVPKNKQVDTDFIRRFFLRKKGKHLLGLASPGGAGRNKTLGQGEFQKLKLIVPPLPEQQKINSFLSLLDTKIEQLEKKKSMLEDYKKGMTQKVFSQELRFKDDKGNDFPDWDKKKLGEVLNIRTGRKDVNEGNPHGIYPFFTCARAHTYSDSFSFDCDAILVAGNGDVGHCQKFAGKFEAYQRTYVLSDFTESFEYLYILMTGLFKQHVDKQIQMGAMPYMKLGTLKGFLIPVPHQTEQYKIAVFFTAIDQKIDLVSQQLTQAKLFKKGLLQQMFV